MSKQTHSSLTALALVFATAAFSQTSSAADSGCPGKAPTSLSAATAAKPTLRSKVVVRQAPNSMVAAKPCDKKKVVIQGAPAKLKIKTAQPVPPKRLKIKLPKKTLPKAVLTKKIAPKKPTNVIVAVPGGSNGGPVQPAGSPKLAGLPAGDGVPKFHQIGGTTAHADFAHGSCANGNADCYEHILATVNGNTDLNGAVSMSCPAGQVVTNLYFTYNGQVSQQYAAAPYKQTLSEPITIQPWSEADFENAGQAALGGTWSGSLHNNNNGSPTEQSQMNRTITVIGACGTGDEEFPDSDVVEYEATTTATFQDLDFNS